MLYYFAEYFSFSISILRLLFSPGDNFIYESAIAFLSVVALQIHILLIHERCGDVIRQRQKARLENRFWLRLSPRYFISEAFHERRR